MKKKINIRLAFIALVAIITTGIGVTFVYYNLFQKQVSEDLYKIAKLLDKSNIFVQNKEVDENVLKGLGSLEGEGVRITWIDVDGTVLFDNFSDIKEMPNHLDRPEVVLAIKNKEGKSVRRSDTLDMNTYYYAILQEDGTIIRVSTNARNITNVLLNAFPVIIIIAVVILFCCVLIGHFLTRKLMKPIEIMAENLDDNSEMTYKELEPFANKIRSQHENILAAAKSRQDFTASISHELKTPITAITGYAEIIENGLYDEESEIHLARQIKHNADRLLSLVNDIIQLSELDHSEIVRNYETIDLYEIAEECVHNLSPMARKHQVTLNYTGSKTCITADRALIREMIENLVQNSIRYNKANGTVNVKVYKQSGRAVVSVADTGIGIPKDQLDRVFERFYRVDKSRSRETGGTGLGLAIVKHIAKIHMAEIKISSTLEEGTEISIEF